MDLSGVWRAARVDERLRRRYHDPDLDDDGWTRLDVPGHWGRHPELAGAVSVAHRRVFATPDADSPPPGSTGPGDGPGRWWLHLDGIATQGDVWLDGSYLGDTDGYFVPHAFEVTDLLTARHDHLLAIEVSCPPFGDPDARSVLTGALQDPELLGRRDADPGGIWAPVHLRRTGPVALRHFRAVCLEADGSRARVALRAVLDTVDAREVVLRTRLAGHEHERAQPAAAGETRVEWMVEIPQPDLWWPHSLGDPVLVDLEVAVLVDGRVSDLRARRTGLRSVRRRRWALVVNGERLFTRGVGLVPTTERLAEVDPRQVRADLERARGAGFDLVRTVAHVAHPALYDAADELGLLVWQDLPLRGLMSRGVRDQARRQAREAVDLLGHHPSVAVWCAHDEPHRRSHRARPTPPLLGGQKPSWNRDLLDRSLVRVLERTDGSRPVVAHTAVAPHLPTLDATTAHLWFGLHAGRAADLADAVARIPRMARFVSACGAPSLVDDDAVVGWPEVDWEALADALGVPVSSLHHLAPPSRRRSGAEWAARTRAAQAELVTTTIELLRRLKYRPTGGFVLYHLVDPHPGGGFGLLAHDRSPKPALAAAVDALRPLLVVVDPLPAVVRAGDRLRQAVHLVNDHHHGVGGIEVTAEALLEGERIARRRWTGEVPADEVVLVGHLEVSVPRTPGADLELRVESRHRGSVRTRVHHRRVH